MIRDGQRAIRLRFRQSDAREKLRYIYGELSNAPPSYGKLRVISE